MPVDLRAYLMVEARAGSELFLLEPMGGDLTQHLVCQTALRDLLVQPAHQVSPGQLHQLVRIGDSLDHRSTSLASSSTIASTRTASVPVRGTSMTKMDTARGPDGSRGGAPVCEGQLAVPRQV